MKQFNNHYRAALVVVAGIVVFDLVFFGLATWLNWPIKIGIF